MACAWRHFDGTGFDRTTGTSFFQVVPHTLGLGPEVWRVLAKCHDIGNVGEYEGDFDIDERIVADLITACQTVAVKVSAMPIAVKESKP